MKYRASIEKIETLRNKGCSASDIAKQLGLAESQVRSILRDLEEQDKAIEYEIGGTQEEVLQRIKNDKVWRYCVV